MPIVQNLTSHKNVKKQILRGLFAKFNDSGRSTCEESQLKNDQKFIKISYHFLMHLGGQHDPQNPIKIEQKSIKNR